MKHPLSFFHLQVSWACCSGGTCCQYKIPRRIRSSSGYGFSKSTFMSFIMLKLGGADVYLESLDAYERISLKFMFATVDRWEYQYERKMYTRHIAHHCVNPPLRPQYSPSDAFFINESSSCAPLKVSAKSDRVSCNRLTTINSDAFWALISSWIVTILWCCRWCSSTMFKKRWHLRENLSLTPRPQTNAYFFEPPSVTLRPLQEFGL